MKPQIVGGIGRLVASVTSALLLDVVVAQGATITVFSGADGGPGTLRQAIFDALPGDTINFAITFGIFLTSDELLINKNLTINGPGGLAVSGGGSGGGFRIFHVAPASVTATISGLAIEQGHALVNQSGGGILNKGTLTINNCTIRGNTISGNGSGAGVANDGFLTITNSTISENSTSGSQGSYGGGIANTGALTITNSTISGNSTSGSQGSYGGGLFNNGTMTVTSSTISGNSTRGTESYGGGISNAGTLTIMNSTVSDNQSNQAPFLNGGQIRGGGVANFGGAMLTIANSTISGNQTTHGSGGQSSGGGVANFDGATLMVMNTTVAGNSNVVSGDLAACGGGIFTTGGNIAVRGTVIARNNGVTGPDVCGPLTTQGFNLIGNNADATITPTQSSDLIGTLDAPIDPLIGPLQYNGGPTFTRALQSDSPAANTGDPSAREQDQRGYFRAGVADIGAFEFGGTVPVSLGNISTRLRVETGDNVLIGGFIITGLYPKRIIVRAIGPSLSLAGALADPVLELRDSFGGLIASNDNWRTDQEAEIMATTIPPSNDLESAIVRTLPANNSAYTAIVRGTTNSTGIGLVEVYDLNRTVDSTLGNISTRGLVQTGDNVLIAGTIVSGHSSQRVIVRAIGPSLNLAGKLADPILELRDTNGELIASNDNWRTDQQTEIIVTTLAPSNDLESAIVRNLAPGNYTAIVRGVNGTTGVAVVEAYALN